MTNQCKGRLGGARAILKQMPTDRPFYASEVSTGLKGGSWTNLVSRDLLMKVGRGGPDKGRRIRWQLTSRAKRLLGKDGEEKA